MRTFAIPPPITVSVRQGRATTHLRGIVYRPLGVGLQRKKNTEVVIEIGCLSKSTAHLMILLQILRRAELVVIL